MDVYFANGRLEKLLTTQKSLRRRFGPENARLIARRLDNLLFATNLDMMRTLPGRTHELTDDRAGTFAIVLKHGYRIIIEPAENPPPRKLDGGLDWKQIRSVVVVGVEDYHD